MPTARPRLTITETEDVARMLDVAAERWPEDRRSRGRLLKRLAERGAEAAGDDLAQRKTAWEQVVASTAGIAPPGTYPTGYLDELRDDLACVIVFDASPLIAYFDAADALHERAVASVHRLGGRRLAISPVTLAEVLVGPTRNGTLDLIRDAMNALGVEEVGLPEDAGPRLAGLRVTTRLKLPDCCVLLAAQQCGAAVLTFDDRLAAAAAALGLDTGSTA